MKNPLTSVCSFNNDAVADQVMQELTAAKINYTERATLSNGFVCTEIRVPAGGRGRARTLRLVWDIFDGTKG